MSKIRKLIELTSTIPPDLAALLAERDIAKFALGGVPAEHLAAISKAASNHHSIINIFQQEQS